MAYHSWLTEYLSCVVNYRENENKEQYQKIKVTYSARVWNHYVRQPFHCSIHFRMRIILRTVLVTFLVFPVCILGSSRKGSGLHPDYWLERLFYFDCAPKIRLFVFLNSWDIFQITLPSFSSDSCAMYSLLFLGASVPLDKLFLGCLFWLSLLTAANFFLFLILAIGKNYQLWRLIWLFISIVKFISEEKC